MRALVGSRLRFLSLALRCSSACIGRSCALCLVHGGGVDQLVRSSPCHGEGCGFESRRSRQLDPDMVSKSVDQATRLAAAGDLRKCLQIAAEIGELEVIEGADPHLEMGALYELSLRKAF